MRVVSGVAGGLRLKVPPSETRPSTDRLREALFSILLHQLEGARVLDLFAGSGALGIESLSRGAARAVFVEKSRQACRVIEDNLKTTRMSGEVICREVAAYLKTSRERFDLIFADPPYSKWGREDLAGGLLANPDLGDLLEEGGLFILEVEKERVTPESDLWELQERRVYGSSAVLFYRVKSPVAPSPPAV
jgi:16S rRNA (guanine966-N2)-methyltransferase